MHFFCSLFFYFLHKFFLQFFRYFHLFSCSMLQKLFSIELFYTVLLYKKNKNVIYVNFLQALERSIASLALSISRRDLRIMFAIAQKIYMLSSTLAKNTNKTLKTWEHMIENRWYKHWESRAFLIRILWFYIEIKVVCERLMLQD